MNRRNDLWPNDLSANKNKPVEFWDIAFMERRKKFRREFFELSLSIWQRSKGGPVIERSAACITYLSIFYAPWTDLVRYEQTTDETELRKNPIMWYVYLLFILSTFQSKESLKDFFLLQQQNKHLLAVVS